MRNPAVDDRDGQSQHLVVQLLSAERRRVVGRLLDRPALLRKAASGDHMTTAAELGALTLSMLRGEEGAQQAELEQLVQWLQQHCRPDIIHLSNALRVNLGVRAEITPNLLVRAEAGFWDGIAFRLGVSGRF